MAASRTPALSPVAEPERIATLDILRAFALFGVFLMNVEYFTRPIETLDRMVEPGLSGANYALAWFEYVFMHGKFWTMFALLFGMGFAVMLERAERAGRSFAAPYLRRSLALFALGMGHAVLIWSGDILHSYAISACVLLVMLRGRWWWLLLPAAACLAAQLVWGSSRAMFAGMIGFLLYAGVAALLRPQDEPARERRFSFAAALPWILAAAALVSAVVWIRSPGFVPLACFVSAALLGAVNLFLRRPGPGRVWRAGAAVYAILPVAISATILLGKLAPDTTAPARRGPGLEAMQATVAQAAETNAHGSYADNVALRWDFLMDNAGSELYLMMYTLGLFLIGFWFIRSGAMRDPAAHKPLFRRLALFGLPVGTALALASASVAVSFDPNNREQFTLASNLMQLANPALCLGYVGAMVLLIHLGGGARLRWLAPAGRMALSNYLLQSMVGTLIFYGYGFGLWGRIDRIGQLLLVIAVFAVQIAISRVWLSRFHFGPMEWLWRAATYGHWPAFLRRPAAAGIGVAEKA